MAVGLKYYKVEMLNSKSSNRKENARNIVIFRYVLCSPDNLDKIWTTFHEVASKKYFTIQREMFKYGWNFDDKNFNLCIKELFVHVTFS